jgi:4,5-dihydroxyphthalate decarboxylase
VDRHPEVVRSVYAAFEAARARARDNRWKLHESSPWLLEDLEAQARVMGPGFEPYGRRTAGWSPASARSSTRKD